MRYNNVHPDPREAEAQNDLRHVSLTAVFHMPNMQLYWLIGIFNAPGTPSGAISAMESAESGSP